MSTIRIVSINLWNDADDVERRMSMLVPQLVALEPHVVGLQEVRMSSRVRQAEWIARALGADYRFAVVDAASERGPIGNAVVSRLPIVGEAVQELPGPAHDRRSALRTELDTPAGRMVFVTAHLTYQLDAAPIREAQVVALDELARRDAGALPTVLCGDFNCTPDSDAYRYLVGRASLLGRGTYWRDAFQRHHPRSDGFTWSARNPYVARWLEPDRRIDFVFVAPMSSPGVGAIVRSRVVFDVPGPGDRYASDHFGVFAEIATAVVEGGF